MKLTQAQLDALSTLNTLGQEFMTGLGGAAEDRPAAQPVPLSRSGSTGGITRDDLFEAARIIGREIGAALARAKTTPMEVRFTRNQDGSARSARLVPVGSE